MKAKKKTTVAMTVRMPKDMDDEVFTTAYDLRQTKAEFVRDAIRRALEVAHERELAL